MLEDLAPPAADQTGQRVSKRYYGMYIGFVRDNNDPLRNFRIRVHCPAVMGDEDTADSWLPWALPCFPLAAHESGSAFVPHTPEQSQQEEDALREMAVWIQFQAGDPRFPVYQGGFYFAAGDLPLGTPGAGRVLEDGGILEETADPPTGTATITTVRLEVDEAGNATIVDGKTTPEPPASTQATYPHNKLIKTNSGHQVELDDTPGAERIRCYHRGGTYWEMNSSGTLVTKVVGKRTTFVSEDDLLNVSGNALHAFLGSLNHQVRGNELSVVRGGRRSYVGYAEEAFNNATYSRTVAGLYTLRAASVRISSTGAVGIDAVDGIQLATSLFTLDSVTAKIAGGVALQLIGPFTGIRVSSLNPASVASEPVYASNVLEAAIFAANTTAITALNGAGVTNPALEPIAVIMAAWFEALSAALAASHTIHRVSVL